MNTKQYRTVIIGAGKGGDGRAGAHSIGYAHAEAYKTHPRTNLVAACDLSSENLEKFAAAYNITATSLDSRSLIAEIKPDIVSICTYAGSHRAIFDQCLEAGVKAIWCEKPLAETMDDARAMERAAAEAGVKVVVNHYRRYHPAFRKARELIKAGAIGPVSMCVAGIRNWDLMEWGTHWLDMIRFFLDDQPVAWVMGQARCSGAKKGYGHFMEEHALAYFAFENGARGLLDGGVAIPGMTSIRVTGTAGYLDISEPKVTLLNQEGINEFPTEHSESPADNPWQLLINDFLKWIEGGEECQLSLRNAVYSTEIYLAAYESAKIGNRIDLPLGPQNCFPLNEVARRQSGV